MRQGNGADILGPNDPRSATIGMIYVAPNDDRESVLAAILTQEKLGRKQIAIVLPDQNRAFQRPVDFDGLKNMRRKLQADLLIIAPSGPGPAEFARQRHFTVYSSVDSFARSLRDQNQPAVEPKRGLFGRKTKLQPASDNGNAHRQIPPSPIPMPMPSSSPAPQMMDDEEDDFDPGISRSSNGNAGMGFVAGAGAGALAASAMNAADYDDETPTLINDDDDWDDLPPAVASPAPVIVDSTATPAQDTMAAPPAHMDTDDDEGEENDDHMAAPLPFPVPVPAPEPDIIQFRNISQRPTQDLPPSDDEEEGSTLTPIVPIPMPEPANTSPAPQRSGNAAAGVGAAGMAAGAATTGRNVGAGAGSPPTRGNASAGNAGTPPRQPRRRRGGALLLALIALLLLTLLVCGGFALAAPNSPVGSLVNHVVGAGTPGATVTIVPASQTVTGNFAILAVTGTPNTSQREVQARQLSYTTPVQSKTVNATGVHNISATQAQGSLTFYNTNSFEQTVAAGTVFTVRGVQIENNTAAFIPAGNLPSLGTVTVPAHAITTGSAGNIPFGALKGSCCGNGIAVENQAFSGGQDPQHYTVVQQSDIDNVANPLLNPTEQSALNTLKGQRRTNEQFVGAPKCSPNVNANPPVGSRSQTVTVSVSASCSGEVYDHTGALEMAVTSLQNQASKVPGASYKLVGQIVPTIKQIQVVDVSKGTISLIIKADGIWEYNFTKALQAQLARQIAGKTQSVAQAILAGQQGVGKVVSISISSGNTLPTDPTQIHFVIQDVPGLSGTPVSSGSPTTITPTSGPGTPQPGSGFNSGSGSS